MAEYSIPEKPLTDIRRIWNYLENLADEQVADRYIERIYECFDLLSEHPYMGVARPIFASDMRSYSVPRTPYIILYYPRDYGVEIASVIDGRRDPTSIFR